MKANKVGHMQKETVSLFCCLVNHKSLCKIMRKIPRLIYQFHSVPQSSECIRLSWSLNNYYDNRLVWSLKQSGVLHYVFIPFLQQGFPSWWKIIPKSSVCFKDEAPAGMPAFMYPWIVGSKIKYMSNEHHQYQWENLGKRLFLSV